MPPRALYIMKAVTTALRLHLYITTAESGTCGRADVHTTGKYLSVFLLNVTVSESHLICFCAICWISRFREVFQLGPETLKTKPRRAPPSSRCVQMHLAPTG